MRLREGVSDVFTLSAEMDKTLELTPDIASVNPNADPSSTDWRDIFDEVQVIGGIKQVYRLLQR